MRWTHLLGVLVMAGCAPSPPPASIDTIAEGYVRVALQLAQHDPSLVEAWRGPEAWRPGPRVPVAPLLQRVRSMRQELAQSADATSADRRAYLAGQLAALELSARRLLGESATFADEALAGFEYRVTHSVAADTLAARNAIGQQLPGTTSLATRYTAFKKRLMVPRAKSEAVLRAALAACRAATLSTQGLPADESIELVFVDDSPWDGFAEYLGRHRTKVSVNRRAAMDVSRALRLACHEGYAGHHWQFILIDDELVRGRGWREFDLLPRFGRHLLVTEGAAEVATDLAFPHAARVALYREVLFPLAGLPVADAETLTRVEDLVASLEPVAIDVIGDYLDGRSSHETAVARLRDEALTLEPDALLAFAERQRSRVLAYPGGRAVVQVAIGNGGAKALHQLFVDRPFGR